MTHIGKKIKQLADKKNLSVQEIAYRVGKTTTAIYDIYRKENINTDILNKMSSVLGVPMSYWFEEDINHRKIPDDNKLGSTKPDQLYILIDKVIDELKNQLKEKDDQIRMLIEKIN